MHSSTLNYHPYGQGRQPLMTTIFLRRVTHCCTPSTQHCQDIVHTQIFVAGMNFHYTGLISLTDQGPDSKHTFNRFFSFSLFTLNFHWKLGFQSLLMLSFVQQGCLRRQLDSFLPLYPPWTVKQTPSGHWVQDLDTSSQRHFTC